MEIGQKVRVCRIRDRVSKDVGSKLGQVGIVQDYKMTDGSSIGVVVRFDDDAKVWFFDDELESTV